MEFQEFLESVPQEVVLYEGLKEIADEVRGGPAVKSYLTVTPTDTLIVAAAYALWWITKIGVDHFRALSEAKQVERRIEIIQATMKETGLGMKQAKDIVDALYGEVSKRSADDPFLKSAQGLIESQKK